MKGYKIRFVLTALSICLCLTACGTATADDNSTAASVEIQSGISTEQSADVSAEQSADVSTEQSVDVSTEASEEVSADVSADVSEEVSAEPMESTDISEDIDISEESAPTEELSEEPSEDESSVAPPAGTTEPEQDVSKPVEDTSKPAEDVSEPVEDTSKPTEDVSKVETPAPHTHSYSLNFYNPAPTCTKDGYNLYKCSCGDSYKEVLPATGHDFSEWKPRSGSTYFTYHDVNNGYAVITLEEAMKDIRHLFRYCNRCRYGEVKDKEGCITPADAEWICNRIIELLNEERAKLGAPALSTAPIAHEMAMVRAQELTVVFAHRRLDGRDSRWIYFDFQYNPESQEFTTINGEKVSTCMPERSSENICGGGASKDDTKEDFAREIVQEFKESPGHWKDLTNPEYTGVGVGVCFVDEGASSWFYDCPVAILTMDKTYG